MSVMKISTSYTILQKRLHWAVVLLLALQYFIFDAMGRPFHNLMESGTASYSTTVVAHIVIGVCVLALALWRLAIRMSHGAPEAPTSEPEWARTASKLAHGALYLLLLLLPLTGLIAWFGAVGSAAGLHETLTNVLMALVILHIGAVAVHEVWWKTGLLARMR